MSLVLAKGDLSTGRVLRPGRRRLVAGPLRRGRALTDLGGKLVRTTNCGISNEPFVYALESRERPGISNDVTDTIYS